MSQIIIKKKHLSRILSGHPWIFSNELEEIPKLPAGSLVEIICRDGKSFGFGLYNPNSLIAVRLLHHDFEPDEIFFRHRISKALKYRQMLFPGETSFRLIYGESDGLPGLVADKYENYIALQFFSAGMEKLSGMIADSFLEILPSTMGIIQKAQDKFKDAENLSNEDNILYGEIPEQIVFNENGVILTASLAKGQKTGYFFDQRLNRKAIRNIAQDKDVLDCFSYTGGFSLNALLGSAKTVTTVDISESALNLAKESSRINGFVNIEFVCDDVFDYLKKAKSQGKSWDLIILDPPAFAKSRKNIPEAKIGYSRLNALGLQLVKNGGFLATSSCSQHITEETFLEIIRREANKQGASLKFVFRGNQSPDHPVLLNMPETNYLKFFIFQKD